MAKEKSTVHPFPEHFSWSFLKVFRMPEGESSFHWDSARMMQAKAHEALGPTTARYKSLKDKWGQKLRPLCGDPSTFPSFEDFRPLHLSREEDWSDWLAWLLKTSVTGAFAEALFGSYMNCDAASFASPKKPEREVPTEDQKRRADIVVEWKSGEKTHIEVKIEDGQLEKAFETSRKLEARGPTGKWRHFILLTDELMPSWNAVANSRADGRDINVILWSDIVRALREALWEGRESPVWRAWAWTFCRAIEKRILRLSEPDELPSAEAKLQMVLRWLSLLNSTQEKIDKCGVS